MESIVQTVKSKSVHKHTYTHTSLQQCASNERNVLRCETSKRVFDNVSTVDFHIHTSFVGLFFFLSFKNCFLHWLLLRIFQSCPEASIKSVNIAWHNFLMRRLRTKITKNDHFISIGEFTTKLPAHFLRHLISLSKYRVTQYIIITELHVAKIKMSITAFWNDFLMISCARLVQGSTSNLIYGINEQ